MQKLTPQIPLNGFGNVDYREFLKKYSGMERPQTSASQLSDARSVSSIGINVPEGTEEHPKGSNLETIPEQAENMEDLEPSMKFPESRNHPENKLSSNEKGQQLHSRCICHRSVPLSVNGPSLDRECKTFPRGRRARWEQYNG